MTMKRKSWQDYQKEIADDHYYYARSCIRQNFFPGSEKLFIDMLRNDLGKDLSDDPKHSSCTGIGYHSDIVPLETIMTVVARQFALMGEAGYENLVTSCITSFGVYTEILATWHEFPETEEKTRENLWKATRPHGFLLLLRLFPCAIFCHCIEKYNFLRISQKKRHYMVRNLFAAKIRNIYNQNTMLCRTLHIYAVISNTIADNGF